ncbi:MAG: TetR family transcriptional regulator [Candidatus Dormiibacterota bacterium]
MAIALRPARRAYRSSRREAQARQTRRRVLDGATAVFLAGGYGAATMRAVAAEAAVSVATVEALFGTKAGLLKAAIDVAIAGDDEPVPVLDRAWAAVAAEAVGVDAFLSLVARAVAAAQARSSGLVVAVFEGAATDPELALLAERMSAQRATTAKWIVDGLRRLAPLRQDVDEPEAVDTVWVLMDSVVFERLTRRRRWGTAEYERWFAASVARLLVPDDRPSASTLRRRTSR